jgi:eukaryotic-like serine/threonine-protein kinase
LNVTGELDKAGQAYQELVQSYPRTQSGYINLGIIYAEQGQYDKAVEATSQAIALAQDSVNGYDNLGNFLLALQRFNDVRRNNQQAQDRKLDDYVLHLHLYALAFLADNSVDRTQQTDWFERQRGFDNMGLSLESDTEAYAGHLRKARDLTRRSVESALRIDNKESAGIWQSNAALREAAFGNLTQAQQAATKALKLSPTTQSVQLQAALAFAMARDAVRGESLRQELTRRFPLDTQIQSVWIPTIRGQLALPENPSIAVGFLKAGAPVELGQIQFNLNLSCLYPAYVRGEAFLAAGDGNAAAAEFQKILDHSGIVWNCWTAALAHLGVARANALQAKTSQGADANAARVRALAEYEHFLQLWKDADPDIPVLIAAKAEYAKLK